MGSNRQVFKYSCGLLWRTLLHMYQVNRGDSPDNKVHGVNMGPTWDLSALGGPHVGPMNFVSGSTTEPIFTGLKAGKLA